MKTDGTREAAAARRLLSAQPWGFASLSEQQVAPRKHSRIYALHLKCSQAKPSFFLYDRLFSRAEVVLFFFWSSLLLFLSLQNLVKSKLRLVWEKKKKKGETHIFIFWCCTDCSVEPVHVVSLTSHSSWIQDRNSEIWLLRHYDIQKTAFSSWPLYFHCFRHKRDLTWKKKREKQDGISQCLDTRTTTSD